MVNPKSIANWSTTNRTTVSSLKQQSAALDADAKMVTGMEDTV